MTWKVVTVSDAESSLVLAVQEQASVGASLSLEGHTYSWNRMHWERKATLSLCHL